MKMTCINVGYGDSLLLEWKDSVMLIDGGSALESEFEGFPARIRSADYLQKTGIGRIDTLIITHIHEDHVCGLTALFDKADIKQVYIPFPPELFKERKIPDAAPDAPENVRLFARSLKDFTKIMEICRVRKIPVKEIFAGDVLDCAVEHDIVKKSGSWFSYNGDRIGQGRENVKNWLEENPEILEEIRLKVLDMLKGSEEVEKDTVSDNSETTEDLAFDEDGVILE